MNGEFLYNLYLVGGLFVALTTVIGLVATVGWRAIQGLAADIKETKDEVKEVKADLKKTKDDLERDIRRVDENVRRLRRASTAHLHHRLRRVGNLRCRNRPIGDRAGGMNSACGPPAPTPGCGP